MKLQIPATIGTIAVLFIPRLHATDLPEQNWFYQAPEHRHLSESGAPLIHPFGAEPAFNHRDLFLDYSFRSGDEGDEHEFEIELEWAVTDRFGLIFEQPYVALDEAEGFGDLAIVPRVQLLKKKRFLLAANLEIGLPTGDDELGFGEQVSLAPSLSAWWDLGSWWTLQSQFGWERGLDSGDDELFGSLALIKTFGNGNANCDSHGHGDADHLQAGLLSLVLELGGTLEVGGDDDGNANLEGIVGFYYGLAEHTDVRIGYQFPVTSPREFDGGITFGIVKHF